MAIVHGTDTSVVSSAGEIAFTVKTIVFARATVEFSSVSGVEKENGNA